MGKVLSMVAKNPFRNFNIESRAHKVISKAKPTPAPKHKSDQLDLDRLMIEYPELYKENLKKHPELDKHLRSVYVVSNDVNVEPDKNPDLPLPHDRKSVIDFEYGFMESQKVPLGKITLRNVLEFITNHQADAETHTVQKITAKYLLPEQTVRNVLKFYRVFEVYVPLERRTKAKFAGPIIPKVTVIKNLPKQLPPGDNPKQENET